jgi:2-hydroxy-3-oxopropionate reductase
MAKLEGVSLGFLGLGDVGRPVLRRLKSLGAELHASSRSPALRYKIARDSVNIYRTPAEVNDKIGAGIVILMLSKQSLIDAFLNGEDGLLANLKKGALVIDLGQTSPEATRQYAALVEEKGARWLDAPALGTEEDAHQGKLTIQAGGDQSDFDRAKTVLEAISDNFQLVGELGAGQSSIITA